MKFPLRILTVTLTFFLLASTLFACTPSNLPDEEQNAPTPSQEEEDPYMNVPDIDLETLRQTGQNSQRWLSVPFSRLVLNPYQFNSSETVTHSDYSDRPSLPLNLGYLDPYTTDGTGQWLENLLTMYEHSAEEGVAEIQYEAELWDSATWNKSGGNQTQLYADNGELSLTVLSGAPEPWQYAAQPISLNLDETPILTITVESCEGNWALKLCENGKADEVIVSDTSKTGTYTYDLAAALGRKGTFEGVIKLFSIGYDKELVISRLDIRTVRAVRFEATEYTTAWTPMALEFTASYANGLSVSGFDTFYNEDTILRSITIERGGALTVAGLLTGKASVTNGILIVSCNGYTYAITASRAMNVRYYEDMTDMLANINDSSSPSGNHYFAATFENLTQGDTITFAITLKSDASTPATCSQEAADALSTADAAQQAKAQWAAYWQSYLRRVPRPERFTLDLVDSKGVGSVQLEQMYYIAWIFLGQNLLPAAPEVDYAYPQVCCGKPSMWAYGEAKAAYSASWESFFGIQLLGYTMPDVAWSALEGLMSLVEEDGMLGGESLPSEKAHTAWLLYELTGDIQRLSGVYDAIGRYLDWRIENPRWIYLEHNDVNSADADFVVSALIDIEYMQKISTILGKTEDAALWADKYDALLEQYYTWNFDSEGNVYQYCDKITFARTSGCTIWVTKGLLINGLDEQHQKYLMNRLHTEYNRTGSFAGFSGVKYPEISHTILGLYRVGETAIARTMAEICARDIVRVGMLSENYTNYPKPTPTGVRPAMFGCAMMIDSILMMNGFSYQTLTQVKNGDSGSVSNLTIRGEITKY